MSPAVMPGLGSSLNAQLENAGVRTLDSSGTLREFAATSTVPGSDGDSLAASLSGDTGVSLSQSRSVATALSAGNASDLLFAELYLTSPGEDSWTEPGFEQSLASVDSLDRYREALQLVLDEL